MVKMVLAWYHRHFSDPQAVALILILATTFSIIYFYGHLLTPLLIAIVLSYLLEWPVGKLELLRIPRILAVTLIFSLFLSLTLLALFVLVPSLWQQGANLIHDLPLMFRAFHQSILQQPYYATLAKSGIVDALSNSMQSQLMSLGEQIVKGTVTSLLTLLTLAVYLILVPFIIFFLLKDKQRIFNMLCHLLPQYRRLAHQVWQEVNQQVGHYVRGKALEILLVSTITYCLFILFKFPYTLLLASLVGLATLIPYIGVLLVSLPIGVIAISQWGVAPPFWKFIILYSLIQGIEGHLIAPLLFSGTLNLHPLVIIISILLFGGLWGFWGVFFAIPLAILGKTVFTAWPNQIPLPAIDSSTTSEK